MNTSAANPTPSASHFSDAGICRHSSRTSGVTMTIAGGGRKHGSWSSWLTAPLASGRSTVTWGRRSITYRSPLPLVDAARPPVQDPPDEEDARTGEAQDTGG